MKRPWHSKTIGLNLAAFITLWGLRYFYPNYHKVLCENEVEIFSGFASVVFLLNILLRRFTKEPMRFKKEQVIVLALLFISACSSVQQQMDTNIFYKRDIELEINGKTYTGVTVIPKATTYSINFIPPGNIDLMLIRSCHREYTVEKADTGWHLFGNKKQKFNYQYTPIPGLEDHRVCPLRVDVYESAKGRQSWALLDFESAEYQVPFEMDCNGEKQPFKGVGVCQSKEQTVQRVRFQEAMRFAPPPPGCGEVKRNPDGYVYEIKASVGECLYHFDTKDGRLGRLIMVGYSGVLVRSEQ